MQKALNYAAVCITGRRVIIILYLSSSIRILPILTQMSDLANLKSDSPLSMTFYMGMITQQ
jgi:hypothetical protein